jgi:hypothetical protein
MQGALKILRKLVLKVDMFKSPYAWMIAYNSPCFSSLTEFLDFCSSFLLSLGFLLYSSCVLGLHPAMLSNEINFLIKKEFLIIRFNVSLSERKTFFHNVDHIQREGEC